MVGMRARVRALVRSRTALVAGVAVSVAVPVVTLPRLPAVAWWQLVLGLVPWVALGGIAIANGLPEAGVSAVLVLAVVAAWRQIQVRGKQGANL